MIDKARCEMCESTETLVDRLNEDGSVTLFCHVCALAYISNPTPPPQLSAIAWPVIFQARDQKG